jgi:adenosylmethionine-8-amino-7-oxononanoate aminotransferase
MTRIGTTADSTPAVLDGPALWPAQAHTPTVLGRQLVIHRGEGSYVFTTDGRRLFDGTAGLWHANIGHSHPELARAAFEQMNRLETYHIFARFTNDKALALGERLAALAPMERAKVILNSGGSDAIDVACKLARRHWQREGRTSKKVILSREFAYHGLHAFGTSIAGLEFNREGYGSESLIPETARVALHDAEQIARTVAEIGAQNIAAIVTEPIQGTGGVNPPAPGYLEAIQKICWDNDILLILDEVITGFGRTGTMFAAERYGVQPDLVTFAKGVTSGYAPLGGVLVSPRISATEQPTPGTPPPPQWHFATSTSLSATTLSHASRNSRLSSTTLLKDSPNVSPLSWMCAWLACLVASPCPRTWWPRRSPMT